MLGSGVTLILVSTVGRSSGDGDSELDEVTRGMGGRVGGSEEFVVEAWGRMSGLKAAS